MGGGFKICEETELDNGTLTILCEEQVAPYIGMYFLFIGMTLGALTLWFQVKFLPFFPFTALMFLEGIGLGMLQAITDGGMGDLSLSIDQWQSIDPLLLMAVFLPALIFSDAFRINIHQFQTTAFWPSVLLAGPGVVTNVFAVAYISQQYLGYEWSFRACLLFGAVLGSTDPVSVTAMVESTGVPTRLKLLMSSESHLADLSVLVLFKICLDLVTKGGQLISNPQVVAEFMARMLLVGPLTGLIIGVIAYFIIVQSVSPTRSSDVLIQVTTTVVLAYMSFLVAEHNFSANGILSTVCAAWVIAAKAWPKFAKRETIESVWDSIAYFGNTLIYLLAGVIIGDIFLNSSSSGQAVFNLARDDWFNVLLVWGWLFAIRGAIVLCAYPLLYRTSNRMFSMADAVLLVFGGLRGGVTITLAIIVKNTAKDPTFRTFLIEQFGADYEQDLDRFFFIIGSVTLMTLIINYTIFPGLARLLRVSKPSKSTARVHDQLRKRVHLKALEVLEETKSKDREHYGHVTEDDINDLVASCVACQPSIDVSGSGAATPAGGSNSEVVDPNTVQLGDCNMSLLKEVRGVFLSTVRAMYWEQINDGKLPRKSSAALKLLNSVDQALDSVAFKLDDLSPLGLDDKFFSTEGFLERAIGCCGTGPDTTAKMQLKNLRQEIAVVKASCFIEAHLLAESKLAIFIGEDESIDTPEEAYVIKESQDLRAIAARFLDKISENDHLLVQHVQRVKLANSVIEQQRLYVESLFEQGLADERFFEEQMLAVRRDQMSLERKSKARMRVLASSRVSLQRERRRSLRNSQRRSIDSTPIGTDAKAVATVRPSDENV